MCTSVPSPLFAFKGEITMNQKYLKRIIASYVREKDVPYIADAARDPEAVVKQFKYLENRDREIISWH